MQNTTTTSKQYSEETTLQNGQERLVDRLEEAGIDTQRFVNVGNGKKSCKDHTQREYSQITGNYGVYAGRGENGIRERDSLTLLFFDIDDYECGSEDTPLLDTLPETFTVASPHTDGETGGHPYYALEGDVIGAIREITGGTVNPGMVWGSIRVDGQLVVGPGSQIDKGDEGCNKDWCKECAEPDGGYYRIVNDLPIAKLTLDELREVIEADYQHPVKDDVAAADTPELDGIEEVEEREINLRDLGWQCHELPYEEIEDGFYPGGRLRKAFESKQGDKIRALWMGEYSKAGFGKDRSKAESALVNHLGWWMDSNWSMVSMLMDFSCEQYPTTEWGDSRKWAERDGEYRESLSRFSQHEDYQYEKSGPNWDLDSEERPEVGHPTLRQITNILGALGIASKKEIMEYEGDEASEWDEIDREGRSVNNGLSKLEKLGAIGWYRNGRSVDYYLRPPLNIPEERFEEKGIDGEELWKNYSESQ